MNGVVTAKEIHWIAKRVAHYYDEFEYVGLRVQDGTYGLKIGDEVTHLSRRWVDGEMTDEILDGICAIDAQSAAGRVLDFGAYEGNVVLVLGGSYCEDGEDDREIILTSSWGYPVVVVDIIHVP